MRVCCLHGFHTPPVWQPPDESRVAGVSLHARTNRPFSACLHQPPVLPGVPVPPPPSHSQVRLRPLPPLPRSSASRLNLQSRGSGELISPKLSDVSAFGLGWWVPVSLLGLCAPVALPAQPANQPPDRRGSMMRYAPRVFPHRHVHSPSHTWRPGFCLRGDGCRCRCGSLPAFQQRCAFPPLLDLSPSAAPCSCLKACSPPPMCTALT